MFPPIIAGVREIVLASSSPRRRALLEALGLPLRVIVSEIDETALAGETPREAAARLARAKVQAVVAGQEQQAGLPRLYLGADTVVEIDGLSLGKPRDRSEARAMLEQLSGRSHEVHTALALVETPSSSRREALASSRVHFRPLTSAELDWYAATGEGGDKAGAYAVQGLAALFIESVEGSYSNVVGLPLDLLYVLALELDWDLKRLGRVR